jgi:hypothetical protein
MFTTRRPCRWHHDHAAAHIFVTPIPQHLVGAHRFLRQGRNFSLIRADTHWARQTSLIAMHMGDIGYVYRVARCPQNGMR